MKKDEVLYILDKYTDVDNEVIYSKEKERLIDNYNIEVDDNQKINLKVFEIELDITDESLNLLPKDIDNKLYMVIVDNENVPRYFSKYQPIKIALQKIFPCDNL
ncbi:hypothetical protein RM629_03820 [Staphylococcus chromogenes]|uniref:hypothetical protein n=1 Tax=Staphylococcus chromogenes TaxID=46126 RepID=UPI002886F829|nr:hypothetical protein [Staphylococcus chromogenes]MDT0715360.1 hypothetical protein [Staphylococcus chromogenes]